MKGGALTSCEVYLGAASPFTIATYESPGDGKFSLTSAICGAKKLSASVLGSSAATRTTQTEDCNGLQEAERKEYASGKALHSLYEQCDGHGESESPSEEKAPPETESDESAKLHNGMMTYRTVSIYVKDLDFSNSGGYHASGGAYSYSAGGLEGCSHSNSQVPQPRTRKHGKEILACDIYLGEQSPFTVATYKASDPGNFTLVTATCGGSNRAAHHLNEVNSSRVTRAKDCEKLQEEEREEYDEEKGLALINLSMSCEDLKQKAPAAGDFERFMAEMTGKPFRNPCKRKPLVRLVRFEAEKPQMIYEDTPSKPLYVKDTIASLTTGDIDKCRPTYYWLDYLDKPEFSLQCDIPGMRSKSYYPPVVNRPRDLSLTTQDIDWAQPKITRFKTNRVSIS
ncbi:hypothetical protein Pmar_PMAR012915 [Perkinsus marinus ATCC 50983]|uniref:Uncharacterized protein n=1 Tax=Perkinsus marinus (strain ATCC 50983 / TXsc) TaxID=423536 RepID=C5LWI8_PERM5|nr:hypothetical protein Pmar_PMAR012915 [Perkinsus marinus ATCC 50983]EEQ98901.1 hypothetical protein Pmar_PMAR012915 [Perkinsus marinus ATCC 50983]|eukprot:XP_002766184.1 hypothetical protein Pmar_PMAR012915 [Perkinsus marinus ATCC 50983]